MNYFNKDLEDICTYISKMVNNCSPNVVTFSLQNIRCSICGNFLKPEFELPNAYKCNHSHLFEVTEMNINQSHLVKYTLTYKSYQK